MTETTLYSEPVADHCIRVTLTRSGKAPTAKLCVRNDIKISGEVKSRPDDTGIGATSIPLTAEQLFNALRNQLRIQKRMGTEDISERTGSDEEFAFTARLRVGRSSNDSLITAVRQALFASLQNEAAERYARTNDEQGGELIR